MRAALLFMAALAAAGCSAAPAGAPECAEAGDCAVGLACVAARCVPAPLDAGPDADCASGGCACAASSDCASPAPCIEAVCVLGTCQRRAYDARCPRGEYCHATDGCTPIPPPPDAGALDAPASDAPDARAGLRDAGLRPVGAPCFFDHECAPLGGWAPRCIDAPNELAPGVPAPPGGYCSAECMLFLPESCGRGAVCVQTDVLAAEGWCLQTCAAEVDCRAEHTCAVPAFGGIGTVPVCLPPL